jgi:acetolactate synthase-1/2/3 large subunit
VKLADAHGIPGIAVRDRGDLEAAVDEARGTDGAYLINFLVEQEDSVYPMIPAGNALHEMIRRPSHNPIVEEPEDE